MCQIKIYNSITEIKREDWDLLTENNVYMCYEYLKTLEETTVFHLSYFYITLYDQQKLTGALVCSLERKNPSDIIEKVLLGRLHKYLFLNRLSFTPSIIGNRQRGNGTHFIFLPGIDQKQIVLYLNKMLDEMEYIAKINKSSICFLNVAESEIHLMKILKTRGYFYSIDLPFTYIDINWTSFQGYEKYISQKHPVTKKAIRRHIKKNRNAGVIIEQLQNIGDSQGRLLELLKMNHIKYNSTMFPLKSNYFNQIKENFGNSAVIYIAIKNGIIIGVNVELRKGNESFLSTIGIDHEQSQDDLTFFNLGYYEPIKYASESGIKRMYYGRGLYSTKIKRGCVSEDMFIFYKPRYKISKLSLKLWFSFHKQWMMHKLLQIKEF